MAEQPFFPSDSNARRESDSSLGDVLASLRRSRALVLAVLVATVAVTMIVTLLLPPAYESEAVLRIKSEDAKGGLFASMEGLSDLPIPGMGGGDIDTEVGVIRSRRIVDPVADSLALHVQLAAPLLPRASVFRVVSAPRDAVRGTYTLTRRPDGSYAVAARAKNGGSVRVPEKVSAGNVFEMGGATLELVPALRQAGPKEIQIVVRPFRETVDALVGSLVVGREEGRSKLVGIEYRHRDPELAAAVVNGISDRFIAFKRQTSNVEAVSTAEILRDKVAQYGKELRDAEVRLRGFRESQKVLNPEEEGIQYVRRLSSLRAARDSLVTERASLRELLTEVRGLPRLAGEESPYRKLAAFPSFLSNRVVQDILVSLNRLEDERSELLVRRTPQDGEVAGRSARIAELETQLFRLASNYLGTMDTRITSADAMLQQFASGLDAVPARDEEFLRLTREQALLAEVYSTLQVRLKQAEVSEALDTGDVRVIDYGLVAEEPVFPRPAVSLVLSVFLGLMLGGGIAIGRDLIDTKVRSRSDVEHAAGGLPVLGTIPAAALPRRGINARFRRKIAVPKLASDVLVTRGDPQHPASEAYRALRTSITFAGDRAPRVLVVTSALPGDGESASAANLAITLAQQGSTTLLVDGDIRRGHLHTEFGVAQDPGLSQVVLGRAVLEEAVHEVMVGPEGAPLHFLAAGAFPPNPAELLGSDRMRQLLQELRERYDMIVFSAPPLSILTDAAILGTQADATLLVARTGSTDRQALEHAVMQLRLLRAPIGGIVLHDGDGGTQQHRYVVAARQPVPSGR